MVIRFIVFEFLFCNLRFEKPRFYGASEATILYLCFCPLVTRTIRNFQPSPPLSEPGKPLISVPISDFRSPPPTSVRAFARQSGFGPRRRDSLRPLPTFDFRFPISHPDLLRRCGTPFGRFPLSISDFRFPTSDFLHRHPHSRSTSSGLFPNSCSNWLMK